MAHIRQSRPDSGSGFQVKSLKTFRFLHLGTELIAHKELVKSFCKSQFPHKSVNTFFIVANIKKKLTDLCVE